jgi:hypothetical protein
MDIPVFFAAQRQCTADDENAETQTLTSASGSHCTETDLRHSIAAQVRIQYERGRRNVPGRIRISLKLFQGPP